jgi:hypothetical protein
MTKELRGDALINSVPSINLPEEETEPFTRWVVSGFSGGGSVS